MIWTAAILTALVVESALDVTAEMLNLRALGGEVPPEFRDVYDAERYRRSQAYTRARTRFGLVTGAVDLAALLVVWFTGGFGALDRGLRTLGLGPIATGVLYVGSLGLGAMVFHLPFRWWSTFVLEQRFGFNRTTARTFWADLAKGLALAAVLGVPLLTTVLWLFEQTGPTAWLWCWLTATVFL